MPISLKAMVNKQVTEVLRRGQRMERFDQIRQRHFWSTYLFAYGAGNVIQAGPYELFKVISSQTGQGYPAGVTLTERETNWKGNGRVPDNQNFVIQEVGVSVNRPPPVPFADGNAITGSLLGPSNGIFANLPAAIQAGINPMAPINSFDAQSILYGTVLEMGFLTNNVPLGLCADFSQSSGVYSQRQSADPSFDTSPPDRKMGDPTNGIPAAAFRRKLEVPILLQHGESMGMRLNILRNLSTLTLEQGGAGWLELRVDWWATESFVELS
jgi:hypothetical protein